MFIYQHLYEIALIIFGLGGLYIANKIRKEKQKGHQMICPLEGNCEPVLTSDFAKIAGIPLEIVGIAYYSFILLSGFFFIIFSDLKFSLFSIILFGLTLFGFLFSMYLTFVQGFVLKNWCTWCLYSALASTLLFLTSSLNFILNVETFEAIMKASSSLFSIINMVSYSAGAAIAIIAEIFNLSFLQDLKIDKKEKILMTYLWQVLWIIIFLILSSSFVILIFDIPVYSSQSIFYFKSIILGFIVIFSFIISFRLLPKIWDLSLGSNIASVSKLSFYRSSAIFLSACLLISWIINTFAAFVLPAFL